MNSFDSLQSDEIAYEPTAADWNEYQEWYDGQEDCYPEDDGQPSEYDEWQDVHGGDDWDHGQYDYYDWE
jgi:hypothetical protein